MVQLKMRLIFWNSLFCSGCITSLFGLTTSSSSLKEEYKYAIDVRPVDRCPMNESEWQAAATRIGCNDKRGYHCVPDKFLLRLIEFCYNKTRIFVAKGHCLELAADGILNYVKCNEVTKGCPDEDYLSDKIYKYQFCLSVAFRCFSSNIQCLDQKFKEQLKEERHSNFTTINGEVRSRVPIETFIALVSLVTVIYFGVSIFVLRIYRKKMLRSNEHFIQEKMHMDTTTLSIVEEEQLLLKKQDSGQPDTTTLSIVEEEQLLLKKQDSGQPDELNVEGELESEIYFEDIYLSLLMRRHCRDGAFKNFEYLLNKKILAKKDQNKQRILTSRDKDGRTLLHYAAEGGCKDIFMAILNALKEINVEIKLDDTTHCGHTVLHLACKNDKYLMCVSLLSDDNNVKLLLERKSNQGWNAAHFAAASGNMDILDLLENKNLDISSVTENGLNVLDIACIHNHTEMCEKLIGRKKNPQTKIDLGKSDARGWAIDHFVAMVGNEKIFNMLEDGILKKTKRGKTVLHICCEYGCDGLYEKVLEKCKSILHDVDTEGWNALHYAAKGGNLRIYKQIEKVLKRSLCETTNDGKTVLHVACINNRVDICRYICSNISYRGVINSQIKTKKWTAAHYVAVEIKRDGAEEELISLLVQGGIDLKVLTSDRLTVLGVACEHRNKNLIKYLLENHFELVGVETIELLKAANETDDEYICTEIQNAIGKYKERSERKL